MDGSTFHRDVLPVVFTEHSLSIP